MTVVTNTPATGQTTLYPLEMLQHNSLVATHVSAEVSAANSGETLEVGVYVISRYLNTLSRLPGSRVTFDCGTIGVQTLEFPSSITLLPSQQYYIGVLPSAASTLRVVGQVVAPFVSVGSLLAGQLNTTNQQTKAWQLVPWVELLSGWGNEVL